MATITTKMNKTTTATPIGIPWGFGFDSVGGVDGLELIKHWGWASQNSGGKSLGRRRLALGRYGRLFGFFGPSGGADFFLPFGSGLVYSGFMYNLSSFRGP